jgi:hypothetical protein
MAALLQAKTLMNEFNMATTTKRSQCSKQPFVTVTFSVRWRMQDVSWYSNIYRYRQSF